MDVGKYGVTAAVSRVSWIQNLFVPVGRRPGLNCQSSENVVGALNPSCQEGRVDSGPSARIDAEIPSSRQKACLWHRF